MSEEIELPPLDDEMCLLCGSTDRGVWLNVGPDRCWDLWHDKLAPAAVAPLECTRCGKPKGPLHPVDADHPGWMCGICYSFLSGTPADGVKMPRSLPTALALIKHQANVLAQKNADLGAFQSLVDGMRIQFEKVERERNSVHDVLREMAWHHGSTHDAGCPEDDTCRCSQKPFNDRVNACCGEIVSKDLSFMARANNAEGMRLALEAVVVTDKRSVATMACGEVSDDPSR